MTEFPDMKTPEYHPWMAFPNVRHKAPIENVPDIAVKFAEDRASKLEVLRFTLAASNFKIHTRAKFESRGGNVWRGGRTEHISGTAPSPLWQFAADTKGGALFTDGAPPGTFPRAGDHRD